MAESRWRLPLALALAILALLAQPGAARQLGDFGRVKPGFVNDELFPAIESGLKRDPGRAGLELQLDRPGNRDARSRLALPRRPAGQRLDLRRAEAAAATAPPVERYYRWLKHERYASSRVRYNTLAADVGADLATVDGVFRSICAVREVDRQRGVAAAGLEGLEAEVLAEQRVRAAENEVHIGRFVAALGYRYAAYSYALDHLLVETPHEEAVAADAGPQRPRGLWVDRAEAGDFCGGDGAWAGTRRGRHSRPDAAAGAPSEGEFRK